MDAFTAPPDGSTASSAVAIPLDGPSALVGQTEESTTGGNIETVTVVIYPPGVTSTLPQSRSPSETPQASSLSTSLPPSSTILSDALQLSSSSPATPFSSQPATTKIGEDGLSQILSIESSSSSGPSVVSPGDPAHTENPPPQRSGSNLANLNPPLYVGIALGGIAAFAIISALVAWCIRSWYSRRRRKAAAALSWTRRQSNDFNGLEAGANDNADWTADSRLLADSATTDLGRPATRHWISASRDVGEPRRGDSSGGIPGYIYEHHAPIRQFFSDKAGPESIDDQHPPHTRKPTLRRQLPSHLLNEKLSSQALAPGPDQVGGEYEVGTPREDVVAPRYLSLNGDALELPWTRNNKEPVPPPRSIAERLRRTSKPVQESWERPIPSDTPGRSLPGERGEKPEGWAGSITSNLVNAFNAVAANIGTFNGDGERRDMLTPKPSKRGTGRKSTHIDSPSDVSVGRSALDHYGSRSSNLSTESSVPWTLEEVADGTGIVHINISPSKERSPSYPNSRGPSLQTSESLSSIPLVASHVPQAARLKPEISHHFRIQPDQGQGDISRQTSYSQQSFVSSTSNATITSTLPLNWNKRRKNTNGGAKKDKSSPASHRQPSLLSRLSSTSSATSWNSLSTPTANSQVIEALRARKRTYSRD